jgi:molybdopterin converting factor small subunit
MPEVIAACSVLIDGVAAGSSSAPLADGCVVDLLPPFAGG